MALPAAESRPGLEKCFVRRPEHSQDPWNGGMSSLLHLPALPMFSWAAVLWSPFPSLKFNLYVDRRTRHSQEGAVCWHSHIPTSPAAHTQQSNELHLQWSGSGDTGRVPQH